jgi:ribonucleoside-diphosphate reductase alpha chain
MPIPPFETNISELVWDSRYRFQDDSERRDKDLGDSWRRVTRAVASVEAADRKAWEARFFDLLSDFRFLPAGRILAGAGTGHEVTLLNCFVMGPIGDSMAAIFDSLKEGALTMQQGGGVGYDFSTLRPSGSAAWRVGGIASGPVSFMRIWDSMCATLLSTAARRGAMMGTLRCDHPDIETFIDTKRDPNELHNFNLSVLISDEFMQAVEEGGEWALVFPAEGVSEVERERHCELITRQWGGLPRACLVYKRLPARELWQRIMRANYETAEPGVLFIDRINRLDNLGYRETISATNPCGEVPLPPYGACDLGSINLTRFVKAPFSDRACWDMDSIRETAALAVRLLDNVIDLSHYPLVAQRDQAEGSRRIGLGITGLADALIMLGLHYGDEIARREAAAVMRTICHSAYRASIALAREKGPFPFFEPAYLESPFIQSLPEGIRRDIAETGLRNSHLTAIAPTGTISLFANNVSSGIEPVFDFHYRRNIRDADGKYLSHDLTDYALRHWHYHQGDKPLPSYFVCANELDPQSHLAMQAALQPYVDNAISKTINLPETITFEAFRSVYEEAYRLGLKGCTTYRPNPVRGKVLSQREDQPLPREEVRCCGLDREAD